MTLDVASAYNREAIGVFPPDIDPLPNTEREPPTVLPLERLLIEIRLQRDSRFARADGVNGGLETKPYEISVKHGRLGTIQTGLKQLHIFANARVFVRESELHLGLRHLLQGCGHSLVYRLDPVLQSV